MKKLIYKMGVVLMVASGCTNSTQTKSENTINIHFPMVSLNLDPHKMEDAFSMAVVLQIHRGLLRYTPSGDVAPDLAETWKESPDHKSYNLKLRPSTFSNGVKIEAKHVQMSFARLFSIGAAIGADLDYIEGVSEFRKTGDLSKLGIKVISPSEIEFRLKHSSALFLKHLAVADCAVLPLDSYKDEIQFNEKTGFSGPYKVSKFDSETGVTLEKWRSDGLDSKNPPKKIHFFPSARTPIDLAKSGETDSLDHDVVPNDIKMLLLSTGWKETATELIAETYLILSPKKVSDEIRKALFSSVDQNEIAKFLGEKYVPAYGAIPRGVPGELSANDMTALKGKAAKSTKGTIHLEFDPDNKAHQKLQKYLKETWEKIGISVKLAPLAKKELLKKLFSSECEVCLGQKGLDYPDGYSVLTYFKSGYPSNYFHINDAAIDKLIDDAGTILSREEREKTYAEIQRKVLAKNTLIPLAFGSEASGLWSGKIKSVPPHAMGIHMLPFETIELSGAK